VPRLRARGFVPSTPVRKRVMRVEHRRRRGDPRGLGSARAA